MLDVHCTCTCTYTHVQHVYASGIMQCIYIHVHSLCMCNFLSMVALRATVKKLQGISISPVSGQMLAAHLNLPSHQVMPVYCFQFVVYTNCT